MYQHRTSQAFEGPRQKEYEPPAHTGGRRGNRITKPARVLTAKMVKTRALLPRQQGRINTHFAALVLEVQDFRSFASLQTGVSQMPIFHDM